MLKVNICVGFSLILSKDYSKTNYGKRLKKDLENLAGTKARCGNISRISERQCRYGTVKTSIRPGNTATPRQIFSNQGLQGLWMCGDTGQAMGVHLRSISHGGHGYWEGRVVLRAYPWHTTQPYGLVPWRRHLLLYYASFPHI